MKIKLYQIVLVLAALIATPFLFDYAAEHRTFSGVGGEAMLIPLAVAVCALIEQGKELAEMWKEEE